ncbi:MAG: alpha-amylase family glycosyl hydrolase [Lachnospiraceae bacterium]|nr:alpha-amylase family glycosyl hydrolase [Lachnospiraceae bacterium]
MAWYDEAVFYHIYPLGLLGAPEKNDYGEPVHRLKELVPWIDHMEAIGCDALYIGPLFQSGSHGYDTTDYKTVDSRLGDNEDLKELVKYCHDKGMHVILDGVFNHVGRDFFAFQDLKANREGSRYKDWFLNVNFWNNNEYNDGFSYDNWGGYNLLVKLNQRNPEVQNYICDVIRYWVSEFDIDGLRLDAADVLDFDFMHVLRSCANSVKPDFWLMGEVIHGEYIRWVNNDHLHAVTDYELHKAFWSAHNSHNYFEIAHTVRRLYQMGGNQPLGLRKYNFVDNHDVNRIMSKITNKAHFTPIHILMYTLPGVPSIYYGSEFGIEGEKTRTSDAPIRPALNIEDYKDAVTTNPCTELVSKLGKIRQTKKTLSYGGYTEVLLTNRQYAFSRDFDTEKILVAVNNDDNDFGCDLPAGNVPSYVGALSGEVFPVENGRIHVTIHANSGDIYLPEGGEDVDFEPVLHPVVEEDFEEETASKEQETEGPASAEAEEKTPEEKREARTLKKAGIPEHAPRDKSYDEMTVPELQAAILDKMRKNGPITEQMMKDVMDNVYHDSLINWVRSFR